ncbi:MAG TPA: glycosyltransferase family 2 protein [Acidimicrobiia bacterium]|nr:glycosyltransferase family 2 protein [Acidimicrobiia bacterium]
MTPSVSVVIPVYNEGDSIVACLDGLCAAINLPFEILVVYDSLDDTTRPHVEEYARDDPRVVPTLNTFGRGPARAIRYGIEHASADVAVVTMADGSDDPTQVDALARLVQRGVVVAAASRYMPGGSQIGAPFVKSMMSRLAGLSLYWFARVGTHDATSSFKAYDRAFVKEVGIESDTGFEVAIELVVKARRRRLPVAEIPTIWLERTTGTSNFKVWAWLPRYLHWYFYAFGSRIT